MVPVGFVNVASTVLAVWNRHRCQELQLFFCRSNYSLTQERQTLMGYDENRWLEPTHDCCLHVWTQSTRLELPESDPLKSFFRR